MSPHDRRPKLTYDAPIGSIDLAAEDDNGDAYQVWPCTQCLPWHAEVIRDGDQIGIREWHAIDCPDFKELLANADSANSGP
jgi:hypothetical protein